MAVGGSFEFPPLHTGVRPGNDPPHLPLVPHGQLPGDLAVPVQVFQTHGLLVAADLKDRVGGGIDNEVALPDLLLPQLLQNFGAAGAFVADNLPSGSLLQLPDEFWGKSVVGEGDKGLGHVQPHHLPVAGHGVLAPAGFPQAAEPPGGSADWLYLLKRVEIGQPKLLQVENVKRLHALGDMTQSVHAHVPVLRGVGHGTHPHGIQHHHKDALKFFHIRSLSG